MSAVLFFSPSLSPFEAQLLSETKHEMDMILSSGSLLKVRLAFFHAEDSVVMCIRLVHWVCRYIRRKLSGQDPNAHRSPPSTSPQGNVRCGIYISLLPLSCDRLQLAIPFHVHGRISFRSSPPILLWNGRPAFRYARTCTHAHSDSAALSSDMFISHRRPCICAGCT